MASRPFYKWEDINKDFTDCLLIGNGSSIAIHPPFLYNSLYTEAVTRKIISADAQKVFDGFGINDFERVLELVSSARGVNAILGITDKLTDDVYRSVQEGLIKVVRETHPDQKAIIDKLKRAAGFSRQFSTIISLNYDLLFYWIINVANEENPDIKFKDGFSEERHTFRYDWEELRNPYKSESKAILCFYPHGNLSIVRAPRAEFTEEESIFAGEESKVVRVQGEYLLDAIVRKWEQGYQPVYVSEGTTNQKLATIRGSGYLREVYANVLPNVGKTLLIYGSAIQRNDEHIFSALCQGSVSKIAVSMYRPKDFIKESNEIEYWINRYSNNKGIDILFFDAESSGAWIY